MVLPAALAFAMVSPPLNPFNDVTPPPPPGQAEKAGAPTVDIKHRPVPAAVTELTALAPLPTITPFAASVVAPVPPFATLSGVPNVRAPVTAKSPPTVIVVPDC